MSDTKFTQDRKHEAMGNFPKRLREYADEVKDLPGRRLLISAAIHIEELTSIGSNFGDRIETLCDDLDSAKDRLAAVGMLCSVASRAALSEVTATQAIDFARDKAPFANLMSTMYGLSPIGAALPAKRKRKP